jgi:hypothetical protein
MLDCPAGREFRERGPERLIGSARRRRAHDGLGAGERSSDAAPPDG